MKRRQLFIVMITSAIFASAMPLQNAQATTVGGIISSDTTWSLASSPILLSETVQVKQGVTLTIEPGVEVVASRHTAIQIAGRVVAEGTQDLPIQFYFDPSDDFGPHGWQGITTYGFDQPSLSDWGSFDHVEISGSSTALRLFTGSARLGTLYLHHNGIGLDLSELTDTTIEESIFLENFVGISARTRNTLLVRGNDFVRNQVAAISMGVTRTCKCEEGRFEVHGNDIPGSPFARNGLSVEMGSSGTNDLHDASANWWGTQDTDMIHERNYDGKDDIGSKELVIEPLLEQQATAWNPPTYELDRPYGFDLRVSRTQKLIVKAILVSSYFDVSQTPDDCLYNVTVTAQRLRKSTNEWLDVGTASTGITGIAKVKLRLRSGHYRFWVPEKHSSLDGEPVTCTSVTSISERIRAN